ncbi:MAG: hypothetical protein M1837_001405 [Sclerophora amabilis]|nr:MAG: hypothetical protein M1837_001405 [Sclerophora amabilis]
MAAARSWLPIQRSSHFSLANIPFGIISSATFASPRPAIAIGDYALDLAEFSSNAGFSGLHSIKPHLSVFSQPTLNAFAALGRPLHREVRQYLQRVLIEDTPFPQMLKANLDLRKRSLVPLNEVQTHLPLEIGDYTDFYAGLNHAYNVGVLFRGPQNALQPNYMHLPVGYHGRASSVVTSGTPIRRPWGQVLENPKADEKVPSFKPCQRLDIELELGAFICRSSIMGQPIPINEAEDSLFGVVLMNDWSARDIQAWEYVPLGPFNAKNFGTTISPWVVLADALEPSRAAGLENQVELQPYLREARKENVYDIKLHIDIRSKSPESPLTLKGVSRFANSSFSAKSGNTTTITRTNSSNLLWSFPQMIAHHSITGCPMRVGDLLGSGTISGTRPGSHGSLLEANQNGQVSIQLNGGEKRKFLEDGDTVILRGWSESEGGIVGFGECSGMIEPAMIF